MDSVASDLGSGAETIEERLWDVTGGDLCAVGCKSTTEHAEPCGYLAILTELRKLQETNARLNRRCQSAESGLAVKLDEVKRQGGSFGRALAFAGYTKAEAENAELRSALAEAKAEIERLKAELEHEGQSAGLVIDDMNERIMKLTEALRCDGNQASYTLLHWVADRLDKITTGHLSDDEVIGDDARAAIALLRAKGDIARAALASPSEPAGGRKGG